MAERFRKQKPSQYVFLFFFFISDTALELNNVVRRSLRYNIGLKCKLPKILLTT